MVVAGHHEHAGPILSVSKTVTRYQVVSTKLAPQWAARPNMKSAQSANRLGVLRRFAEYMSAYDPRTERVLAAPGQATWAGRREPAATWDGPIPRCLVAVARINGHYSNLPSRRS
jgi:hypothetical protein